MHRTQYTPQTNSNRPQAPIQTREQKRVKILTGRTPNEVILTDELKEHLAIRPEWVLNKSLPKRFLSRLSQLRTVVRIRSKLWLRILRLN